MNSVQKELLDAVEIMIDSKMKNIAQIYRGIIKSTSNNTCVAVINGETYTLDYYGNTPTVNMTYPVFVPQNNMALAFIIN